MNYYIQGNAAKADKIRAAFEMLGYKTIEYYFNSERTLYFTFGGAIETATYETYKSIIKTHPDYKELELPIESKFKVGDWVVKKNGETFYGGNYAEQITLIEVAEKERMWLSSTTWIHDDDIRLWTIQDAKDGDVLVPTKIRSCPFIYRRTDRKDNLAYYYAGIDGNGDFSEGCLKRTLYHFGSVSDVIPATKEQRDLLFSKMEEAGYQWDAVNKELKKIQSHYDIANFKPFDKVLVRDRNNEPWRIAFYGYYNEEANYSHFVGTCWSKQCIPYNDDTKHLLGTTDMPSEEYINW